MKKQITVAASEKRYQLVIFSVLVVLAIFLIYILVIRHLIPSLTDRGLFGDSFGGLNTIFSGLALLGIIYALLLQQRQLSLQSEERKTNESLLRIQIDKIQRSFELQYQPILQITPGSFLISKPRIFTTNVEGGCCTMSRYRFSFKVKNSTDAPAVDVIVASVLFAKSAKEQESLSTAGCHFNVISKEEDKDDSFLYVPEKPYTILLEALRDRDARRIPKLEVKGFYRNMMGACFYVHQGFHLLLSDVAEATLVNWQSSIMSFSANYMNDIARLKKLEGESTKWREYLLYFKERFSKNLLGDDEIFVSVVPIPGAFQTSYIRKDAYEEEVGKISMPKLTFVHTECLHNDVDDK